MRPIRGAGRIVALLLLLLVCLGPHLLTRVRKRPSSWSQRFLAGVARLSGADVTVRGVALHNDVLFVANHQSWLDIPIIAGATGTAFVARSSIRQWPLVGWLASLNDSVFVENGDRAGVAGQVAAVRAALGRHQPVTIFPEGTTGAALLPFKPALLAVVAPPPSAIRVQPLRVDYGMAAHLAWIGDEPVLANLWRVLTHRRFAVTLDCLEPFDPAVLPDRKAIAAEARARIQTGSAWTAERV